MKRREFNKFLEVLSMANPIPKNWNEVGRLVRGFKKSKKGLKKQPSSSVDSETS